MRYFEIQALSEDAGWVADPLQDPAFIKWFGESVVRDDAGKPLRVYHGTHRDFDSFSTENSPTGMIFFATETKFASGYAATINGGLGGRVLPCYLRIEKLYDFRTEYGRRVASNFWSQSYGNFDPNDLEQIRIALYGREDVEDHDNEDVHDNPMEHEEWMTAISRGEYPALEMDAFIHYIHNRMKFDGMVMIENGSVNYAVFSKFQIKSAVSNTGAFNRRSGRIGESLQADRLGYTVDAYHGTSNDFTAFSRQKNSHLGFHFGSTPKAAEEKLKADRKESDYAQIKRGGPSVPIFSTADRDRIGAAFRKQEAEIKGKLEAISHQIGNRSMANYSKDNEEALIAALERDDQPEVDRLLKVTQTEATPQEAEQIAKLKAISHALQAKFDEFFGMARPGERVLPVRLKLQNPIRMKDTNWGDPKRVSGDNRELRLPSNSLTAIRTELEQRGHDGIVYQNEVEDVGQDSFIVFSPSQIRSRFAKFNPAKQKSGNISEAR